MSNHAAGPDGATADRMARAGFRVAFWAPLAICTYLALTPAPPTAVNAFSAAVLNAVAMLTRTSPEALQGAGDVVLHGLAFTYLTLALGLAVPGVGVAGVVAWMLAYGGFLEVAQSLVPSRTAELRDLLVDSVGICAGVGLLLTTGNACRRFAGAVCGRLARQVVRLRSG